MLVRKRSVYVGSVHSTFLRWGANAADGSEVRLEKSDTYLRATTYGLDKEKFKKFILDSPKLKKFCPQLTSQPYLKTVRRLWLWEVGILLHNEEEVS